MEISWLTGTVFAGTRISPLTLFAALSRAAQLGAPLSARDLGRSLKLSNYATAHGLVKRIRSAMANAATLKLGGTVELATYPVTPDREILFAAEHGNERPGRIQAATIVSGQTDWPHSGRWKVRAEWADRRIKLFGDYTMIPGNVTDRSVLNSLEPLHDKSTTCVGQVYDEFTEWTSANRLTLNKRSLRSKLEEFLFRYNFRDLSFVDRRDRLIVEAMRPRLATADELEDKLLPPHDDVEPR